MASPLNLQPRGLLDFFGIKNGEWGPRELQQVLQGNIDLWRHYVASNALDVDGATAAVNGPLASGSTDRAVVWTTPAGNVLPSVVPASEIWFIDSCSILAVLNAVAGSRLDALGLELVYTPPGQAHFAPFPPITRVVSDAANVSAVVNTMLYPYWALPGQGTNVAFSGVIAAGGQLTTRVTARLARMRI